jgi:hypothetical protein
MSKRRTPSVISVIRVSCFAFFSGACALGCGSSSGGADAGQGGGSSHGCYQVAGPTGSELCAYQSNSADDKACPSGFTTGSCPSTDSTGHALIGCCVTTLTGTGGGATDVTAGCYYDSTSADSAKTGCPKEWSTTAP